MAQFIPKRDETLEADPHQKWLEKWVTWLLDQVKSILTRLAKVERELAANGKQTAVINARTNETTTGGGLPSGGITGMVPRRKGGVGGSATWTTEWQGLMPEYWVTLDSVAGASYYVSGMGIADLEATDQEKTKALLPAVTFDSTGTWMYAIDGSKFPDGISSGSSGGEAPFHLVVNVNPSFDGEEFHVSLPDADNPYGVTSPLYTFELHNDAASFDAVVYILNTSLYYEGSVVPVLGDSDSWTVGPGFYGAWTIRNVKSWGTAASPTTYDMGGVEGASSDEWYEANILDMRHCFEVQKEGTLSVATLAKRTYNNTLGSFGIGKVFASVGTAPSGVDLTMVVKKNGTSISSAFTIAAGANTGTAVLTDTAFSSGDYLTIEVTQTGSAADLNVQIWAG